MTPTGCEDPRDYEERSRVEENAAAIRERDARHHEATPTELEAVAPTPTVLHTAYGDFPLTRRAKVAVSVVRAKHNVYCRSSLVKAGDYAVVEHRKVPRLREHVGAGWGAHVATYTLDGLEVPVPSCRGPSAEIFHQEMAALERESSLRCDYCGWHAVSGVAHDCHKALLDEIERLRNGLRAIIAFTPGSFEAEIARRVLKAEKAGGAE